MQKAVIVAACLAISGCASQRMREAQEAFASARGQCDMRWPQITRETVVPRAQCVGAAEEATILPASGDFSDLVYQRIAFRNALAAKVAAGEVPPEEYDLRFAQFNSELANQAHAREAEMAQAQSQRMVAAAALIQATKPAFTPPPIYQPAPVYFRPVQTNCMNIGNMTNCTSQ